MDEMSKARPQIATLYHYTNTEGLLGIVQKGILHASDVSYMNDSAEIDYAISILHEALEGYEEVFPIQEPLPLSRLISDVTALRLSLNRDCLVCAACFCEDGDLLSQWRGYAPNNGFSVGFSRVKLEDRVDEPFPVIYDREAQLDFIGLSIGLLEGSLDPPTTELVDGENLHKIVNWSYTIAEALNSFKSHAFHEEHEWRICCTLQDEEDPERMCFRSSPKGLVPYLELDVGKGMRTCISEIVVGPTTHPDEAKRAVELLLASTEAGHVPVRNSEITLRA